MKRGCATTLQCESCQAREQAVICNLPGEDLVAFVRMRRSFQYEPHQVVFYEGHASLGLYLLCKGKVKVTRSARGGQRQILGLLGPGQVIEKQAFRLQAIHQVSCETLEPCEITLVPIEAYLALLRRNPPLALKVIELLSRELGRQLDQLEEFSSTNARERLARLLLDLAGRFGRVRGGTLALDLRLTREELAELVGVSVETVIRLLKRFEREGLVAIEGRAVSVLKIQPLEHLARR